MIQNNVESEKSVSQTNFSLVFLNTLKIGSPKPIFHLFLNILGIDF